MLIAAAVLMAGFGLAYFFWKESGGRKALIFKAMATFMPVLAAFFYAMETRELSAWCIFAGVVSYMAADVLLEIWFLAGVAAFGMGHCFVIASLLLQGGGSWYVAAAFAIYYGLMFVAVRRYLSKLETLLVPGLKSNAYSNIIKIHQEYEIDKVKTTHYN